MSGNTRGIVGRESCPGREHSRNKGKDENRYGGCAWNCMHLAIAEHKVSSWGLQTEKPGQVQGYFTEDPNATVEFRVRPVGHVGLLNGFN